jgi:16S rRNA (adenine(1408)-N(1))-methyltransferase
MAESSLRAARSGQKGGLPNAVFLVAAAERPPEELVGIADEVTITMPWGSLLDGALALDRALDASAGIAALLAPGGRAVVLLSVDARDRLALPTLDGSMADELAARWRRHGLTLSGLEPASDATIAASGSSWARRLGAGRDRRVWRIELARTPSSTAAGTVRGRD